jgi:hypothetical protein
MRTLDLGLDIVNGVRGLHLKGDSLAREGLHENLHDGDLDSGVDVVLSREEKEVARNVRLEFDIGSVRTRNPRLPNSSQRPISLRQSCDLHPSYLSISIVSPCHAIRARTSLCSGSTPGQATRGYDCEYELMIDFTWCSRHYG